MAETPDIPKSHPRYQSLMERHLVEEGVNKGIVAVTGLIAHGRGECFDYLLGERTIEEAWEATEVAVAMMLKAKNPVISVNGNVAALCAEKIIKLSGILDAPIEVNLFYGNPEREKKIKELFRELGADVLGVIPVGKRKRIPNLDSRRGLVDPEGIYRADVVLVPLEDGDRTEALVKMGKKVIVVDLNPFSRSAKNATVTIVDNITRVVDNMVKIAEEIKGKIPTGIINEFDNTKNLQECARRIKEGLSKVESG